MYGTRPLPETHPATLRRHSQSSAHDRYNTQQRKCCDNAQRQSNPRISSWHDSAGSLLHAFQHTQLEARPHAVVERNIQSVASPHLGQVSRGTTPWAAAATGGPPTRCRSARSPACRTPGTSSEPRPPRPPSPGRALQGDSQQRLCCASVERLTASTCAAQRRFPHGLFSISRRLGMVPALREHMH